MIFLMLLEGDETQEFFDELCKEFASADLSPGELTPIENGKSLVFPQFSMKLKRETTLPDGLKLYEQLIFANDFEQPIHSIKFRPFDSDKDILISHPFIFGEKSIFLTNTKLIKNS